LGAQYAAGSVSPQCGALATYWLSKAAIAGIENAQETLLQYYPRVSLSNSKYTTRISARKIRAARAIAANSEVTKSKK
jgi:TPR repeat protein